MTQEEIDSFLRTTTIGDVLRVTDKTGVFVGQIESQKFALDGNPFEIRFRGSSPHMCQLASDDGVGWHLGSGSFRFVVSVAKG
jgi:hypothetical protein